MYLTDGTYTINTVHETRLDLKILFLVSCPLLPEGLGNRVSEEMMVQRDLGDVCRSRMRFKASQKLLWHPGQGAQNTTESRIH